MQATVEAERGTRRDSHQPRALVGDLENLQVTAMHAYDALVIDRQIQHHVIRHIAIDFAFVVHRAVGAPANFLGGGKHPLAVCSHRQNPIRTDVYNCTGVQRNVAVRPVCDTVEFEQWATENLLEIVL